MKKLLLFAMIILPTILLSQTVSGLKVETAASSPSTVTFDVSWTAASLTTPWLDSMWVFVDYNKNGRMTRLLLSGGTLTEHSAIKSGTGIFIEENPMGAWVYGDARTNSPFSATVQLYTDETTIAGACAYASSYPPVGAWLNDAKIEFTGTPMYEVTLTHTDKSIVTVESGSIFLLSCDYTATSFTDRTGAPGIFNCALFTPTVASAAFCYGASGQLLATTASDATLSWYDAPTGGALLSSGGVLPLTPLYNNTTAYYAQAAMDNGCVVRTRAVYTVNNCTMGADCPEYTAGSVGVDTPMATACSAFYPGQIGATGYPVACVAFDVGRIGQ